MGFLECVILRNDRFSKLKSIIKTAAHDGSLSNSVGEYLKR